MARRTACLRECCIAGLVTVVAAVCLIFGLRYGHSVSAERLMRPYHAMVRSGATGIPPRLAYLLFPQALARPTKRKTTITDALTLHSQTSVGGKGIYTSQFETTMSATRPMRV